MAMKQQNNTNAGKKRVFIVDDHTVVRYGITRLLNHEHDLMVCGEAAHSNEALDLIPQSKPDVVLMDVSMKDLDGIKLTRMLRNRKITIPILMLSMHDESFYACRAIRAGANGYVNKSETAEKLVEAIRRVMAGELVASSAVKDSLILVNAHQGEEDEQLIERLSDRERQIFLLIGEGKSIIEIAEALCLSPKTVDSHRSRIKNKLRVANSKQLLLLAADWISREGLTASKY